MEAGAFFLSFLGLTVTWTPKVYRTMAFMAVIMDLGLLSYKLLGFGYVFRSRD